MQPWGTPEPCGPFPGSQGNQLEPVWNQLNGSQGSLLMPDQMLCWSPCPAAHGWRCPAMHRRHRGSSCLAASPRRYRPISSRSGGILSFRKDGGNGKGSTSSLGKYNSSEFISWRVE